MIISSFTTVALLAVHENHVGLSSILEILVAALFLVKTLDSLVGQSVITLCYNLSFQGGLDKGNVEVGFSDMIWFILQ